MYNKKYNRMKYDDLKYYINKDNLCNIKGILLSKDLFCILSEELCESHFEIYDHFYYDDIKFELDKSRNYKMYAIIYEENSFYGNGYTVLSENERIIKAIIE